MNIVTTINSLASLGASWIMWVLVMLSIAGVAIVVERAVVFAAAREDVKKLRAELISNLKAGRRDAARHRLQESPSFEARIAAAGLSAGNARAASERMAGETSAARCEMERNLAFLGTVGNNAPFVGLLGTVIGIVRAFHALEGNLGQVSGGLMTEIGEALAATAVGILVALPAVACFNGFQRVIQARLSGADVLSREILAWLETEES